LKDKSAPHHFPSGVGHDAPPWTCAPILTRQRLKRKRLTTSGAKAIAVSPKIRKPSMPNVVVGCDSSPGQTEEASDRDFKRDRQERPTDPDGKQRATIAGRDPSDQQVGNDINERRTAQDGELACSDLAEKRLEER
jgi:hypothetical protein